jgi:3-hydroxy-9,10-secoandrosta-1,3,5(10)-triene-9,17-dione monooxygenase
LHRSARDWLQHLGARQCVRTGTSQRLVCELRDACSPGSKLNSNPIYRTPFIAVHTYALLGPALGLARGGYAEFTQWTKARYLTYTQLAIAQHVPVQLKIAEIAAQIDAADLLARRALSTARADYTGMSMETRTRLRRDFTYAMKSLRDAMDALVKISGSSALMEDNLVQRCWRDVHAISSHVVMNSDVPAENFGPNGVRPPAQPRLSDVLKLAASW